MYYSLEVYNDLYTWLFLSIWQQLFRDQILAMKYLDTSVELFPLLDF